MAEPPAARGSKKGQRFLSLATACFCSSGDTSPLLLGVADRARGQDITLLHYLMQEILLPLPIGIQRYGGRVDDIEFFFKDFAQMFVQVVGNIAD